MPDDPPHIAPKAPSPKATPPTPSPPSPKAPTADAPAILRYARKTLLADAGRYAFLSALAAVLAVAAMDDHVPLAFFFIALSSLAAPLALDALLKLDETVTLSERRVSRRRRRLDGRIVVLDLPWEALSACRLRYYPSGISHRPRPGSGVFELTLIADGPPPRRLRADSRLTGFVHLLERLRRPETAHLRRNDATRRNLEDYFEPPKFPGTSSSS